MYCLDIETTGISGYIDLLQYTDESSNYIHACRLHTPFLIHNELICCQETLKFGTNASGGLCEEMES